MKRRFLEVTLGHPRGYSEAIDLGATMNTNVNLSSELVQAAKRLADIEHRSVAEQIELYFRMAAVAEANPDLSFTLIREIMKADAEETIEEYSFN